MTSSSFLRLHARSTSQKKVLVTTTTLPPPKMNADNLSLVLALPCLIALFFFSSLFKNAIVPSKHQFTRKLKLMVNFLCRLIFCFVSLMSGCSNRCLIKKKRKNPSMWAFNSCGFTYLNGKTKLKHCQQIVCCFWLFHTFALSSSRQ